MVACVATTPASAGANSDDADDVVAVTVMADPRSPGQCDVTIRARNLQASPIKYYATATEGGIWLFSVSSRGSFSGQLSMTSTFAAALSEETIRLGIDDGAGHLDPSKPWNPGTVTVRNLC